MLKFGVCDADDLRAQDLAGPGSDRKFIAVSLYEDVATGDAPDRDLLLEKVLVRFASRNASLKRTQASRFEAFDTTLCELLAGEPAGKTWRVHDMAVSDGRTTADFFELLTDRCGLSVSFLASDYAPDVEVVTHASSRLQVARDPRTGTVLQVVWPPFVFNVQKGESPLLYPLNHAIRAWLLRTRVPDLLARAERGEADRRTVWLLHPRCRALRDGEPRFTFERRDLLEPASDRFDLIRAMNVLNVDYFSPDQHRQALRNLAASLVQGGLLVTGSNEDAGSTVNGAVYRRTAGGFERCVTSGEGSPVDALVLETRVPADPPGRHAP